MASSPCFECERVNESKAKCAKTCKALAIYQRRCLPSSGIGLTSSSRPTGGGRRYGPKAVI